MTAHPFQPMRGRAAIPKCRVCWQRETHPNHRTEDAK